MQTFFLKQSFRDKNGANLKPQSPENELININHYNITRAVQPIYTGSPV